MDMKDIKLVNLTNHDIVILNEEAFMGPGIPPTIKLSVPPSGALARVGYKTRIVETCLVEGRALTITSTEYGSVTGLPPAEPGVYYIVSKLVAEAVRGKRDDVLIMSGLYRDKDKRVLGCKNLARLQE
jgi:hypothetical protein